ncbi:LuxR C-terminal-related transcriptional regulator, partial [Luedemannella flava]|uniref:LuxR C-terminal-related transcriptional regulator n=1 Tax=Luedemannella flava TaxID=349316 RepID=UPI0031DA14C7
LAAADDLDAHYPIREPGTYVVGAVRAEGLALLGDVAGAEKALAEFAGRITGPPRRSAVMALARGGSLLAAARGRHAEALDEARRGRSHAAGIGMPLEAARFDLLIADAEGALGRRAAAERHLRVALSAFATTGARAYTAQTLAAAERLGVPLGVPPAALDGLTAAERAVASLVCQGLSNRDIAARLVISVKTVEFHLTRVFRRLDVANRAQLRRVLAEHG